MVCCRYEVCADNGKTRWGVTYNQPRSANEMVSFRVTIK